MVRQKQGASEQVVLEAVRGAGPDGRDFAGLYHELRAQNVTVRFLRAMLCRMVDDGRLMVYAYPTGLGRPQKRYYLPGIVPLPPARPLRAKEASTLVQELLARLPPFDPHWEAQSQYLWLQSFARLVRAVLQPAANAADVGDEETRMRKGA